MTTLSTIVATMRPPFLLLVLSCLSLSFGFAHYLHVPFSVYTLSLIVVCGLSAHIAVNMLNEYFDCTSKLDFATHKTPFSGGSGALVSQPVQVNLVKYTGILFVGLTIVSGLVLLQSVPTAWLSLLWMGIAGCFIVVSYTPLLNRVAWLCLVAPGLGFGLLMSYGSFVAINGQHNIAMFLLALVPTLLINNLLLLNQYPDAIADAQHGRKHAVIKYGCKACAHVYAIQWALALLLILFSVAAYDLPWYTLLCLLPMGLGWQIYRQALQYQRPDKSFQAAMGQNVLMTLTVPLLIGVSLCVGA